MTESETVARLRAGYEAFNRGDFDGVVELLHPDIEWSPPPSSPDPHVRRGRDEARGYLEPNLFDQQSSRPLGFIERGDRILVEADTTVRGSASGLEVDMVTYHVWTIRDGLAIRFEVFTDRDEALAALQGR